jgi:hypothetical protein
VTVRDGLVAGGCRSMDELGLFTVRVRCPEHGVGQASVPWARPGLGFTLLFSGAGAQLRYRDTDGEGRPDDPGTRHQDLAGVVEHHVHAARSQTPAPSLTSPTPTYMTSR